MANLGEKLGKLSLAILENFVESKLGKKFVDELREPTDRAIAVTTALEQTENVFRGGYDDKEVSKALFEDLEQKDRPALQEAVGKYYDHPTDPSLRQALREILFDEFKDVLSKERIDKAVDHYIKTLTKELIQTDDGFRDNIAALATYEGSLADQRSAQYLEQIAAWTIQHQIASSMPPETHDSIGYIPSARVVTYIERGKIEDDVRTFLQDGGTGAIVGLHAPGGLGKTELAKHTAEELKDQFEGVLWVDVGDHKPEQVIADILTKFGVQMPPNSTYEQQVNELRHAFENRRLLVVFDDLREDALDGLQDFMPPKPNSTLITSRIEQIGGVNKTFLLDHMTPDQARQLMEAVLGEEVVKAEVKDADRLAERCAWNPLAVEIAARRARQFQGIRKPIAHYLEIALTRFSELKMAGDERWNMERVFDLSYEDLSAEDQRRFRALAVFHPTGFATGATAHLWGIELNEAREVLSRFINLSLVKIVEGGRERYRLHDLLDEYAGKKLRDRQEEEEAVQRLAEWLIGLYRAIDIPNKNTLPLGLLEKDNLLKACTLVRGYKDVGRLALLCTQTYNWFNIYFYENHPQWLAWLQACLQLGIDDLEQKASVLKAIGDVQGFHQESEAALQSYLQALTLFRASGDRLGEANTLQNLGRVQGSRNDHEAALQSFQQALTIFKAIEERLGEANTLRSLGHVQGFRDDHEAALQSYQQALILYKDVAERVGEAHTLHAIGRVHEFDNDHEAAIQSYLQALTLFRAIGDRLGEANTLRSTGDLQQFRNDHEAALKSYQQALTLFKAIGDRLGEANVLQAIGDVQQFRDDREAALKSYDEALKLFKTVGDRLGEANVLHSLGRERASQGDVADALEFYQSAQTLFEEIGHKYSKSRNLYHIAYAQMGLEDYDQALQNLLRSATLAEEIKALPLRQRALETIAMISKERMAWGSFNDILAKLIASHPNDLDLIHMQASALFEQKEYEKALPSFQHLTQITPGDSSLWNELGSTLEGLKRMKEAIDVFSHAIVISPETAYLRRNRANALIELNRLSEAEEDIAKAVELEPDHPYTHARQGDLALAQGKFSKALPHFEFAAANDDNKSWKIGVALSKFGMDDLEVARTELSTALSEANDEEREEARDWLERIVKIKPELEKDAQSLREMLSKT